MARDLVWRRKNALELPLDKWPMLVGYAGVKLRTNVADVYKVRRLLDDAERWFSAEELLTTELTNWTQGESRVVEATNQALNAEPNPSQGVTSNQYRLTNSSNQLSTLNGLPALDTNGIDVGLAMDHKVITDVTVVHVYQAGLNNYSLYVSPTAFIFAIGNSGAQNNAWGKDGTYRINETVGVWDYLAQTQGTSQQDFYNLTTAGPVIVAGAFTFTPGQDTGPWYFDTSILISGAFNNNGKLLGAMVFEGDLGSQIDALVADVNETFNGIF